MDYINRKRAELRSHLSAHLLLSLAQARTTPEAPQLVDDGGRRVSAPDSTAPSMIEDSYALTIQTSSSFHGGGSEANHAPLDKKGAAAIHDDDEGDEDGHDHALQASLPLHMNQTVRYHFPGSLRYQCEAGDEDPRSIGNPSLYSSLTPGEATHHEASSLCPSEITSYSSNSAFKGRSKSPPAMVAQDRDHALQITKEGKATKTTDPPIHPRSSVAQQAELEIDLTLSRSLTYQTGSQGYVMNRVHAHKDEDRDRQYIDSETELAREVALCIEEREKVLLELQLEAALLRKAYLEAPLLTELGRRSRSRSRPVSHSSRPTSNKSSRPTSHKSIHSHSHGSIGSIDEQEEEDSEERVVPDRERLEPLLAKMTALRRATMDFADAFGAWARLLHKQKAIVQQRERKRIEQSGTSFARSVRSYSVVVAYRSSAELYPVSQAVHSSVKKFSRDMQPVKYATESKLVGVYQTRDEAVAAFEKAYNEIPDEYVLLEDRLAVSKCLVGLRSCGQHYWVRSNGVPAHLPCEQCGVTHRMKKQVLQGVPEVYATSTEEIPPISQYIWKGQNYLEKVWRDADFLSEVEFLQRVYPQEDFQSNPLLLSNKSVFELLTAIQQGYKGGKHQDTSIIGEKGKSTTLPPQQQHQGPISTGVPDRNLIRHPLDKLRGRRELLRDAQQAGDRHNQWMEERRLQAPYKDHPFNTTWRGVSLPDPDSIAMTPRPLNATSMRSTRKTNTTLKPLTDRSKSTSRIADGSPSGPPLSRSASSGFIQTDSAADWQAFFKTQTLFDDDVMANLPSHRERITRTLQVIGQCPIPENYVSVNINTITLDHTVDPSNTRTGAGLSTALRDTPGGDRRDATVTPTGTAFHTEKQSPLLTTATTTRTQLTSSGSEPQLTSTVNHSSTKSSNAPNTTLVETFYAHRGAMLSLLQVRRPVAHRLDDVFCRTDVGEWMGLQKGRAMRAFEFQDQLYLTGKLKEKQRKDMQAMLRAAYSVDVVDCDVSLIRSLVEQAKVMRGSVLSLDILQCEVFLRKYRTACKYALRGQSWYRGTRDRKRVLAMKKSIARAKKHYRVTEIEACRLAKVLVPDLLMRCVATVAALDKKAMFRVAMNFSGELCMVSLYRQPSTSRKPIERLCEGCRTVGTIRKYEHGDRSYSSHRAPCTCIAESPIEAWQLRVYNPLSRETTTMVLSVEDVRATLAGYVHAHRMRSVERISKALSDPAFASSLAPLFTMSPMRSPPRSNTTTTTTMATTSPPSVHNDKGKSPRLRDSIAAAYLRAMQESSVLPRIPFSFSRDLQKIVYEKGLHRHYQPLLDIEGYSSLKQGPTTLTIDHYHGASMHPYEPVDWEWRPLTDLKRLQLFLERATALAHELHVVEEDRRVRSEAIHGNVKDLVDVVEQHEMAYEDARGRVVVSCESIDEASRRIAEVMLFSKQLLEAFSRQEKGVQEDSKQSYEAFEDAEGWRDLNDKRKLQKAHVILMDAYNTALQSLTTSRQELQSLLATCREADRSYHEACSQRARHLPLIALAHTCMGEMRRHTGEALKALLATYSMPRKHPIHPIRAPTASSTATQSGLPSTQRYTSARRLQKIPWGLVFVRDPLERMRQEHRVGMAVLQRKTLNLKPAHGTLDKRLKDHLRCVALVLLDELTGNMVVHIGQGDGASVEESHQHVDLRIDDKAVFSDLTSHAPDSDIVLRPEDVEWIVRQPLGHMSSMKRVDSSGGHDDDAKGRSLVMRSDARRHKDMFVLPSQLRRSLTGCSRRPDAWDRYKHLRPGYMQRRVDKERKQIDAAAVLLQHLRLQPHTGRPCLGLLHFRRRIAFSRRQIEACDWLTDLVQHDPLSLINHLGSAMVVMSDVLVQALVYHNLRRFDVNIHVPLAKHPVLLHVEIAVADVIASLVVDGHPLMLASFLYELVLNSFSPRTIICMLSHLQWDAPGCADRYMWRRFLSMEKPHPHYAVQEEDRFRGPVHACHRFISGRYFRAVFYLSAHDDVRIELMRPVDGKFSRHHYEGPSIVVVVSRAELCAIVAKVALKIDLGLPLVYIGTMMLLHPHHREDMLTLLLDLLHINLYETSSLAASSKSVSDNDGDGDGWMSLSAMYGTSSSLGGDVCLHLSQLAQRVELCVRKYNAWVGRRCSSLLQPIAEPTLRSMLKTVQAYDQSSSLSSTSLSGRDRYRCQYRIMTHRDARNIQRMRVFDSVWCFLDQDKFFGNAFQQNAHEVLHRLYSSSKGASLSDRKSLSTTMTTIDPMQGMDSLMGVEVYTDVLKENLLVDIRPVDLTPLSDGSVDAADAVRNHELALFSAEDDLSRAVQLLRLQNDTTALLSGMIHRLRTDIHSKKLPAREALLRRQSKAQRVCEEAMAAFLSFLDNHLQHHAVSLLKHTLDLLFGNVADHSSDPTMLHHRHQPHLSSTSKHKLTLSVVLPMEFQREAVLQSCVVWLNAAAHHYAEQWLRVDELMARVSNPYNLLVRVPQVERTTIDRRLRGMQLSHMTARLDMHDALIYRDPYCWSRHLYSDVRRRMGFKQAVHPPGKTMMPGRSLAFGERRIYTNTTNRSVLPSKLQAKRILQIMVDGDQERDCLLVKTQVYPYGIASMLVFDLTTHREHFLYLCAHTSHGFARTGSASITLEPSILIDSSSSSHVAASVDDFSIAREEVSVRSSTYSSFSLSVSSVLHITAARVVEKVLFVGRTQAMLSAYLQSFQRAIDTNSSHILRAQDSIDRYEHMEKSISSGDKNTICALCDTFHKQLGSEDAMKSRDHHHHDLSRPFLMQPLQSTTQRLRPPLPQPSPSMTGIYVPHDEGLSVTILPRIDAASWTRTCSSYLNRPSSSASSSSTTTATTTTTANHNPLTDSNFKGTPGGGGGETMMRCVGSGLWRMMTSFSVMYFDPFIADPTTKINARILRLLLIFNEGDEKRNRNGSTIVRSDRARVSDLLSCDAASLPTDSIIAFIRPTSIVGDVMLLVRNDSKHTALLQQLFHEMSRAYAPMRALRLQKDGRERLWRIGNHMAFRAVVNNIAGSALSILESMLYDSRLRSSCQQGQGLSVIQLRLLMTRFNDLLRRRRTPPITADGSDTSNVGDSSSDLSYLEYMSVMDPATVYTNDDVLLRFDQPCPLIKQGTTDDASSAAPWMDAWHPVFVAMVAETDTDPLVAHQRMRLQEEPSAGASSNSTTSHHGNYYLSRSGSQLVVSAGQVVYCLYQLHCYNCSLPFHACKLPGCGLIRSAAIIKSGSPYVCTTDDDDDDKEEAYTGRCVVDEEILNSHPHPLRDPEGYAEHMSRWRSLRGSGLHPIDLAIKQYFHRIDSRDGLFTMLPPLRPSQVDPGLSVEQEIAMEREADEVAMRRRDEQQMLSLCWEQVREEVTMLRSLRPALVRPETATCLTCKEVLRAMGGLISREEEDAVRRLLLGQLKATRGGHRTVGFRDGLFRVVDATDGDGAVGSPSSRQLGDTDAESVSDSITTITITKGSLQSSLPTTHCVPLAVLRAVYSKTTRSGASDATAQDHQQAFDPYPEDRGGAVASMVTTGCEERQDTAAYPSTVGENNINNRARSTHAMSRDLFELLMQRLRLTRPNRLPIPCPSSAMVPSSSSHPFFRFDRRLYEQVVVMKDGSIVLVQIMYGVLAGASLSAVQSKPNTALGNRSHLPGQGGTSLSPGAPPAAVRFLATTQLPQLMTGLTVLVYDVKSTVSRACVIHPQSMVRVFEAFGVRVGDCPSLAQCIGRHAHKCLQLTRVGGFCTAVLFSIAALEANDDDGNDALEDGMELLSQDHSSQLEQPLRSQVVSEETTTTMLTIAPAPSDDTTDHRRHTSDVIVEQQSDPPRRVSGHVETSPRRAYHRSPIQHRLAALRHYLDDDDA